MKKFMVHVVAVLILAVTISACSSGTNNNSSNSVNDGVDSYAMSTLNGASAETAQDET